MGKAVENLLLPFQGLYRLTGPIFDKELRVSSRRRRNYLLRFAYLAAMIAFVAAIWAITVQVGGPTSPVFRASRMAEAGKRIVTAVVVFQFFSAQVISIVMLSTAISDEIINGTLGVLATTPISSVQIVVGKMLSKLLQLVLLLAVSLPLLAIIRVFGGVPWDYVISSLCITLTTALFTGSASLLLSVYSGKASTTIVRSVLFCYLLFSVPALVAAMLQFALGTVVIPQAVLVYTNPGAIITLNTSAVLNPAFGAPYPYWPAHCLGVLAASVLLLVLATVCVRRAALRQATGQAGFLGSLKERRIAVRAKTTTKAHPEATAGKIRPVKGPPLIWKELRGSLARVRRGNRVVGLVIAAALLVVVYGYCAYVGYLWVSEVHTGFVAAYLFLGLFRTATYSATSITSEKEARTWPILLATPLRDRQIIIEKIAGSSVRPWPVWLLLGGHALVFSLAGLIDPAAILPLTLLVLSSALMVSAVGVFFSSCFRKTSLAATVNLIVFFVSVVPVCCPLPIFFVSPVLVAVMILGAAQHGSGARAFAFWPRFGVASSNDLLAAVFAFLALVLVYWLITFILFALATSNVRRRVF